MSLKKVPTFEVFIFTFMLINQVFAQDSILYSERKSSDRVNQQTIDIEFNYFAYSFAHKFKENLILGAGIQFGFGLQFYLNTPKYLEYSGICYEGNCPNYWKPVEYYETRKSFFTPTLQMLKFQIFYRKFLKPNFYFDLGVYYSLGNLPTDYQHDLLLPSNTNNGINLSAFYGFDKIKFGHRIQYGNIHINYNDEVKTDIKSLLLTIFVLQFWLK